MRVVFFGTPFFSACVLNYLLDKGVDVVAVVTQPDRPQGRSGMPVFSAVKQVVLSRKLSIPIYQEEKISSSGSVEKLALLEADLFVVVAFGEIIKENLLNMPRYGCINLHTSILPKYRGAAPIQRAIMEGEVETGVTVMYMAKKLDNGDIIKIVKTPIEENMTYGEVEENLCEIGKEALHQVIVSFTRGVVEGRKQSDEDSTYAKKIETMDCMLSWDLPAKSLHNLVRGVTPKPGAWCYILLRGKKRRLKIKATRVVEGKGESGQLISYGKEGVVVACGKDALSLLEIQLEGKKTILAKDFVQGVSQKELAFILQGG